MGKKKKRRKHPGPGPAESTGDGAPPPTRPSAPQRLNRPFAEALRGLEGRPERKPAAGETGARATRSGTDRAVAQAQRDRGGAGADARRDPGGAGADARRDPRDAGTDAAPTAGQPQPGGYSYEDRVAFHQAFSDVRPLAPKGAKAVREPNEGSLPRDVAARDRGMQAGGPSTAGRPGRDEAGDAAARARLASLVAGGLRFQIRREDDGYLEALRSDAHPHALRALVRGQPTPQATLDLHGERAEGVEPRLARFVRERHRRGDRLVRVVHGKGHHSEGGVGVLADRVVRALTEGGAAPLVLAFASAPMRQGGTGALLVQLGR